MTQNRALVTGAAGFMGSHVADSCLALGMDVVATDDLSGGFIENVPADATWIEGDLRDADFVRSLWDSGPFDFVYHLGAYAAEGLSHFIRAYNYRTNLEASVNLINNAVLAGVRRFVFTSSIAVYGAGQVPMREDMAPIPEDPYGISKYAVELDLAAAHHMFGLDYTVFRPHNVYGERQHIADRYQSSRGHRSSTLRATRCSTSGPTPRTRSWSSSTRSPSRSTSSPTCFTLRRVTRSYTRSRITRSYITSSTPASRSRSRTGSSAWPNGSATAVRASRLSSRARSRWRPTSRPAGASGSRCPSNRSGSRRPRRRGHP
jgi:dTDP-4-dehydrorhamnose reductase